MIGPTQAVWCDHGPDGKVRQHKGCVIKEFPRGCCPFTPPGERCWMVSWYPLFKVYRSFQDALDWAVSQQFEEIEVKWEIPRCKFCGKAKVRGILEKIGAPW